MTNSAFSLSTSVSLIRRVQEIEPGAWETLLKLYGPLVYRCARNRGVPNADAADVVQIVFLSVWRGISNFTLDRPDATFRGWLHTITVNAVREQVRRQRARVEVTANFSEWPDPKQEPASAAADLDVSTDDLFSHLITRALQLVHESVDPATWQAFWATTIEDQPVDSVASQLALSTAAVRQAKYRVLCRLRTLLADQ